MPLLLRGTWDGILGQRSWHKARPPDQTQDREDCPCQDLAHVKAAYFCVQHLADALVSAFAMFSLSALARALTRNGLRVICTPSTALSGSRATRTCATSLTRSPPRCSVRCSRASFGNCNEARRLNRWCSGWARTLDGLESIFPQGDSLYLVPAQSAAIVRSPIFIRCWVPRLFIRTCVK